MKVQRSHRARNALWIAAVAATAASAHAAQRIGGQMEPAHQLQRPEQTGCAEEGVAQGSYELPSSTAGALSGFLTGSNGEAAYFLEANLTTYLVVFDPRQPRYGGIEGLLLPLPGSSGILPVDLVVVGGWQQQPGELATFAADVIEVNAVTGTVYGTIGSIRGTFQPSSVLALAADMRIYAGLEAGRERDAQPPENASLGRGSDVPPPPAGAGSPAHQDPDVHGAASAGASIAHRVKAGAHQAWRERPQRGLVVAFDDPPRVDGPDQQVPGTLSPDALGGSGSSTSIRGAPRAGDQRAGRESERPDNWVRYDDLRPEQLDREVPGAAGYDGGLLTATAAGDSRAYSGAAQDGAASATSAPETGLFFAAWGICD